MKNKTLLLYSELTLITDAAQQVLVVGVCFYSPYYRWNRFLVVFNQYDHIGVIHKMWRNTETGFKHLNNNLPSDTFKHQHLLVLRQLCICWVINYLTLQQHVEHKE